VTAQLGDFPKPGDRVECGPVALKVKEVRKHRVTTITVERTPW
jgi:CBS domain containing-hemolysin-like protein